MSTQKIVHMAGLLAVLLLCGAAAQGRMLEISTSGETEYSIITGSGAIPAEEFAAEELSGHLARVTGAEFRIISETDAEQPAKAIYVGHTRFAAGKNIDFSALGEEEWVIKTFGDNLVLTGGRPRGTLYAVYEFLEEEVGCRWFGITGTISEVKTQLSHPNIRLERPYEYNEAIPSIPSLRIGSLDQRNKPAFWQRLIGIGTRTPYMHPAAIRVRNKDNRPPPEGFSERLGFGRAGLFHSFYSLSHDFPEDKPEYRAMNHAGQRPQATSPSGPGQICLTNPGAREHVLGRVIDRLARDRKAAEKAGDGRVPEKIVPVTPNDSHWACQCPDCKAFIEREEADSGPYLDFVNYIADGIRDQYPDVMVEGWAYSNFMKPPGTIRPRDNVSIRVIQLKGEWAVDAARRDSPNWLPEWSPDYFRPRNHPVNRRATEEILLEWSRITPHLSVWDYWVVYLEPFLTPYVNMRSIYQDLRLYRDSGVGSIYAAHWFQTTSFYWLKIWGGWKLMQDPDRNLDELVKIFMDGYYGPAAEKMTEYFNHLEDSIAAVPAEAGNMSSMRTSERPYLTLEFYETCQRLLDQAEALCEEGSRYLSNVQHERISVDSGLYAMWHILEYQLPAGKFMPRDKQAIVERYKSRAGVEDARGLKNISESHRNTFLAPLASTGKNNLLMNGDFSEGLAGWRLYPEKKDVIVPGTDRIAVREAGGASLKGAGEEGKQVLVSQQVEALEGVNRYRLSGWIKKEGFTNSWQANIQASVAIRTADGRVKDRTAAAWNSHYRTNHMGWRFIGKEFGADEGEKIISLTVTLSTSPPGGREITTYGRPNRGTVWFDDIALEPVRQSVIPEGE